MRTRPRPRRAHAGSRGPRGARTCVDDDAHDGVRVPDGAAAQQQVVLAQPGLAPAVMHAAGEGGGTSLVRTARGAGRRGEGTGHGARGGGGHRVGGGGAALAGSWASGGIA